MHPHRRTGTAVLVRVAIATLLAVLGLSAVAAGAGAATPGTAKQGDGTAWSVRTVANKFGADRQNYSYTLNPGGSVKDALAIVNHGTVPLDLAVYSADGFTTTAGQLDLLTAGATSKNIGRWVTTGKKAIRVAPGATVQVPFTLALPANATPGDYLGGVVTSLTVPDTAQQVNVDRRLAIRIRLRVSGDLKPALSVEKMDLDYSGTANPLGKGSAKLTYTIRNTGNAILAARQSASVAGLFGWGTVRSGAIADTPGLLPGDTWKVTVPFADVAPGLRLTGKVALTPLMTDASGTTAALKTVHASTHALTVPWALLLVLVVLVALVAGAVVRKRQAGQREQARVDAAVAAALREQETPADRS